MRTSLPFPFPLPFADGTVYSGDVEKTLPAAAPLPLVNLLPFGVG